MNWKNVPTCHSFVDIARMYKIYNQANKLAPKLNSLKIANTISHCHFSLRQQLTAATER